MTSNQLTLDDIEEAHARIRPYIHHTLVLTSQTLDTLTGARVFFKCEGFQHSGSFKARGAFNSVFLLSDAEAVRGVVTSSSGNQAAALALAAKTRGVPAYVAMPRTAVKSKVEAVQRYGGKIVWVQTQGNFPTAEEYEATVRGIEAETGASLVHPYNALPTVAGQGTCAAEFLEERADLDMLLAPVGGGGLISGTAVAAKGLKANIRVIGCEPAMADDAYQSLRSGRIVPQRNPRTIADGLRAELGDITYALIARHVDDIVTVSEEAIVRAMRLLWEVLKIVTEPSSAVPLAAVLEGRVPVAGNTVGIILTGGNVDLETLPWRP